MSFSLEVRSRKLDGPADRPMTYAEIAHIARYMYDLCGRILLRDAADCDDLMDVDAAQYQIINGTRSGHDDMICTKPLGHEAHDPDHTFVTLLTRECVWGERYSMGTDRTDKEQP